MKIFQNTGVLLFLLLLIPGQTFSQDILYKKDSTILKVNIIDFNGKTIIYQIPGDSSEMKYFLSKSILDSIEYSDGKSLDFTYASQIKELPSKKISRNYFSSEIINSLSGNLNIDYERISETGMSSIVIGLLINVNNDDYNYWDEYHGPLQYYNFNPHYFFARFGINYYPFNYSLVMSSNFRVSTGLSILLGSYRKVDFSTYTTTYGFDTEPVFAGSLMWNIKERLYMGDHLQIAGGLETSILPFFTFFCPQVDLSFCF